MLILQGGFPLQPGLVAPTFPNDAEVVKERPGTKSKETPGLRQSCYEYGNKLIAITKRTVSRCVTFGLINGAWLLTPFFRSTTRPVLFGKPVSLWRHGTTILWGVESHGFCKDRLSIVLNSRNNRNMIVRSSIPLDQNGKLVLKDILTELNTQLELDGRWKLTEQNIHLDLYSLNNRICEPEEWEQLNSEIDKLKEKGVSAAFKPSPVSGTLFSAPACLPAWMHRLYQRIPYYLTWTSLPALVGQLQDELDSRAENGKKKIILVHCAHGIDRTGMVCGALKMKNGESYEKVRKEAQKVAQTRSGYNDLDGYANRGLENFAWRLKLLGKGSSLGDIEWRYQRKDQQRKEQ